MDCKEELRKSLKNIYGFNNYLNKLQEQAVENICEGKRDVMVRGFGKSICYQLPIMIQNNSFIIVITCRIVHIKQYMDYFATKQITTYYLTSNTSRKKRNIIENDIISKKSQMKILFITPVQYETAYFKTILRKIDKQRLSYIVIDESDNIFSKQENLCNQYQNLDLKIIRVPIIAISTKASTETQKAITKKFKLVNPKIYAMPVLRTNLYCDARFINVILDPMSHLIKFIENCYYLNSRTNSANNESWGLIVCKDLEATASIATFLTSAGILALPHYIRSNESKSIENPSLKNIKGVKVITVCEENYPITVTNSLVKVIAKKSVRFIVYWYFLPSIEKYYLLLSRARCFYEMSYCRIYCLSEELMNYSVQSSSVNDISDKLPTVITSLIQMQCRHKVYSDFFGDIFSACKNYCDVCKEKEEVKDKIIRLLQSTDNQSLGKLQTILQSSTNSNDNYNENLQYEHSQQMASSNKTQSNANVREETKSSVNLREETKLSANVKKRTKSNANVGNCDENLQYKCLQQTVSSDKTKSNTNVREDKKYRKHDNSSLLKNLEDDEGIFVQNKVDKKLEATLNLDKVYERLFSTQPPTESFFSTLTQSSNITTKNKIRKMNAKTSEKSECVIACDNEHYGKKRNSRDGVSYLNNFNNQNSKKVDSKEICLDGEFSSNKALHFNNRLDKPKKSHDNTKKNPIETITIDDDETNENYTNDDDILFVKEVRSLNQKRNRSTVSNSKIFEQTKRSRLV